MLTRIFIALNIYIRKEEKSQINNVIFQFRNKQKREKQTQSKKNEGYKKIRAEINQVENRQTIEKMNETNKQKNWSSEKNV